MIPALRLPRRREGQRLCREAKPAGIAAAAEPEEITWPLKMISEVNSRWEGGSTQHGHAATFKSSENPFGCLFQVLLLLSPSLSALIVPAPIPLPSKKPIKSKLSSRKVHQIHYLCIQLNYENH